MILIIIYTVVSLIWIKIILYSYKEWKNRKLLNDPILIFIINTQLILANILLLLTIISGITQYNLIY